MMITYVFGNSNVGEELNYSAVDMRYWIIVFIEEGSVKAIFFFFFMSRFY